MNDGDQHDSLSTINSPWNHDHEVPTSAVTEHFSSLVQVDSDVVVEIGESVHDNAESGAGYIDFDGGHNADQNPVSTFREKGLTAIASPEGLDAHLNGFEGNSFTDAYFR